MQVERRRPDLPGNGTGHSPVTSLHTEAGLALRGLGAIGLLIYGPIVIGLAAPVAQDGDGIAVPLAALRREARSHHQGTVNSRPLHNERCKLVRGDRSMEGVVLLTIFILNEDFYGKVAFPGAVYASNQDRLADLKQPDNGTARTELRELGKATRVCDLHLAPPS